MNKIYVPKTKLYFSPITISYFSVRNGVSQDILARELVPGDMVVIGLGDRVPADIRILQVYSYSQIYLDFRYLRLFSLPCVPWFQLSSEDSRIMFIFVHFVHSMNQGNI